MMNKFLLLGLTTSALVLSACSHIPFTKHDDAKAKMANPASQYCVDQGGKLKALHDAYGNSFNNCKLPKGQEMNEWDLYRQTHPN